MVTENPISTKIEKTLLQEIGVADWEIDVLMTLRQTGEYQSYSLESNS